MARLVNRLSAQGVAKAIKPGLHADGGGLYLRISAGAKGGKRAAGFAQFLKDAAKPRQRPEMPWLQRQHPADILYRRAVAVGLETGRGQRIPALGEIGRVIGQGGQVIERAVQIADRKRIPAAFQQQVHRRRSRFRPFRTDLAFGALPLAIFTRLQFGKQGIER